MTQGNASQPVGGGSTTGHASAESSGRHTIAAAVIGAVATLVATVLVIVFGNQAGVVTVVLGSSPTSSATVLPRQPTVTVTVTAPASSPADPTSGRQVQWGPAKVTSGNWVDFDTVPPKNQAGGGEGDVVAINDSHDPALETHADVAVWAGSTEPTVSDCLEFSSTNAQDDYVHVKGGDTLCIHTSDDRLAIAKVTKASIDQRTADVTVEFMVTVWAPA